MTDTTRTSVTAAGIEVTISSPNRVLFPEAGLTKRDLVDFYIEVADVLMPHCRDRPCNLERHPHGVGGSTFVQKRLPDTRPAWLGVAEVTFGSGSTATELCPASVADVVWAANLGAITVHPWCPACAAGAEPRVPDQRGHRGGMARAATRRTAHRPRPDAGRRVRRGPLSGRRHA